MRPWGAALFLAAATLAAYGMTLRAPVISDDLQFVRDNAIFQLPARDFLGQVFSRRYFSLSQEGTYQPLVTVFHYLTHARPFLYRLAGILLHALNALLVFLLSHRLKAEFKASLLAALLFVFFPAQTEAVNISSFKGHLLAFAFSACSLLSWMRAIENAERPARPLGLSYLCFFLALLSKETGMAALGLIAAYSLVFAPRKDWKKNLVWASGFLVLGAAYLALRFGFLIQPEYALHGTRDPLELFGWYLKTLFVPFPLCRERVLSGSAAYIPLAGLYFAALWLLRRERRPLFALLWIGAASLPFLRLVPFAAHNPVADRYLYSMAAGFCLLLGSALARPAAVYASYALILSWGLLTIDRNGLYRDRRALYEQTVACAPSHPRAHAVLGQYHLEKLDFQEARRCALDALALDARYPGALNILGISSYYGEDFKSAQKAFEKAIEVEDSAEMQNNLGNALAAQGQISQALAHYRRAMELKPGWALPRQRAAELSD